MKTCCIIAVSLASLSGLCAGHVSGTVRLSGPFGARLDRLVRNHVAETDVRQLADVFRSRNRNLEWQTEFWGKYMHGAMPLAAYSGDTAVRARVEEGVDIVLGAQEPCGYIGDYPDDIRMGAGWDVWGVKYTLMGLMFYSDGEKGEKGRRALEAAQRLCDYLIAELGPGGRRRHGIVDTGFYGGMASGSVLEPVVWLYRRTGECRYLDFATAIVRELTEREDGPRLVEQASVPVAERRYRKFPEWIRKRYNAGETQELTKAYEMMSCYQGMLDYVQVKCEEGRVKSHKDDPLFKAAVATAESIAATEINLVGGAAAGEHWFGGAANQTRDFSWQQETCVTTTWMRFCQKLLEITDDPRWADQIERTFYNAYLAALKPDASVFAAYTPLNGSRAPGHHHCRMHTNCCNANGPRGFVTVLEPFLTACGDTATLNFYMSGRASVTLPASGRDVAFRLYTVYPREGAVTATYAGTGDLDFALRLRIPAFSSNTVVKVNGEAVAATAGSYCEIRRTWKRSDVVSVCLELPVRMHRAGEKVAFTRGPVALARDTRFGDGALDDMIDVRRLTAEHLASFKLVQAADPEMFMAVAAFLPAGPHPEDPDNGVYPQVIRFTDYASAGNLWRPDCRYRVWLPEQIPGRSY